MASAWHTPHGAAEDGLVLPRASRVPVLEADAPQRQQAAVDESVHALDDARRELRGVPGRGQIAPGLNEAVAEHLPLILELDGGSLHENGNRRANREDPLAQIPAGEQHVRVQVIQPGLELTGYAQTDVAVAALLLGHGPQSGQHVDGVPGVRIDERRVRDVEGLAHAVDVEPEAFETPHDHLTPRAARGDVASHALAPARAARGR